MLLVEVDRNQGTSDDRSDAGNEFLAEPEDEDEDDDEPDEDADKEDPDIQAAVCHVENTVSSSMQGKGDEIPDTVVPLDDFHGKAGIPTDTTTIVEGVEVALAATKDKDEDEIFSPEKLQQVICSSHN